MYMFVGFQHIWRKCCLVRTFCVPVCCVCKAGGDLCSPSLGPCMFITISAIQRVQNKRDLLWCTPTLQRLKHIYRAKSLLHTILVFQKHEAEPGIIFAEIQLGWRLIKEFPTVLFLPRAYRCAESAFAVNA